jgi:pimeloyl-ACP methyl ester carboxylesterase
MIRYQEGGSGSCTLLLLHGMGATAAVWTAVARALQERGGLRWLAADLSGHGGSLWRPLYSVGQMAAELAQLVGDAGELYIVGHSLGAYIGLALASGWFAVDVRGVLGIGPKIDWPPADVQAARELAARPLRRYATADEAWTRYRRVSGLTTEIALAGKWLERGVVHEDGGWRLAQDPRTFAVAGAPFASLAASATAPVLLARGEHDPMVTLEQLRAHAREVYDIPHTGHNAHVENPVAVIALLERLLSVPRSSHGS